MAPAGCGLDGECTVRTDWLDWMAGGFSIKDKVMGCYAFACPLWNLWSMQSKISNFKPILVEMI